MTNPFERGLLPAMPLYARALMSLAFWFISFAAMSALGLYAASAATGVPVADFNMQSVLGGGSQFINGFKIIQLFYDFGLFVFPALFLCAVLLHTSPVRFMGMQKRTSFWVFLLSVALAIVILPTVGASGWLNQHLKLPSFMGGLERWMRDTEAQKEQITMVFIKMQSPRDFVFDLFAMAIVPAIAEEFFFRGFLQKALLLWFKKAGLAVVVAAFVFSFSHFEFYGFVPRFLLGLLLGYTYLWTGDIKVPILIHFANNFMVLLEAFSVHGKVDITESSQFLGGMSPWFLLLSVLSLVFMLYWFRWIANKPIIINENHQNEN